MRGGTRIERGTAAFLLAAALIVAVGGTGAPPAAAAPSSGYSLVASDGGIFAFGDARFLGSTGNIRLNRPMVGMAATPSGNGYWLVASDGGIFSFGDARFLGSTGAIRLNRPIVGMAASPSGNGYWLVASDGGIFAFDARFLGSAGNIRLNQPIVGMAATPSGNGYWLVASDGGIFNFGDARFLGSTGNIRLNRPIVGVAATPSGNGYWLAASDGGIFNFGDARFLGSTGAIRLNRPVVGISSTGTGEGYWLVASDGGIFNFGDARFLGSTGAIRLNQPIVGMAALRPGAPLPTSVTLTPSPVITPDATLLAAGDIADGSFGAEATARLLDRLAGTIVTLGDNAYERGTATEFARYYHPTWGRHKDRTRPSPGGHEYLTPGASGYYGYFGAAAGDPAKGYYSYDVGSWHVVALNAVCEERAVCAGGALAQRQWLRDDLAASRARCTLAYWHNSRFSSGSVHGSDPAFQPLWDVLYEAGADVVLSAHDHLYERFAPQTPAGAADPARGIRQFVVGTGGRSLYGFRTVPAPNSEARDNTSFGVLKLTLRPAGYEWEFVPQAGRTFTDRGSGVCH